VYTAWAKALKARPAAQVISVAALEDEVNSVAICVTRVDTCSSALSSCRDQELLSVLLCIAAAEMESTVRMEMFKGRMVPRPRAASMIVAASVWEEMVMGGGRARM
jgi:hypothetical protein